MKMMFSIIFTAVFCLESYALSITSQSEINSLMSTIENNYGPLSYKEQLFDFSWERLKSYYQNKLLNSNSTEDFYHGVSELLGNLKDAHVSVTLPSNFSKALPLEFTHLQGKTFINFLGQRAVQQCSNLDLGHELISFNGYTPKEYRKILAKYSGAGNKRTDLSYLTLLMTRYYEFQGIPKSLVAGNEVNLVLSNGSRKYECALTWDKAGYPLVSRSVNPKNIINNQDHKKTRNYFFGNTQLSSNWLGVLRKLNSIDRIAKLQDNLVHLSADHLTKSFAHLADGEKSKGRRRVLGSPQPFFKLPNNFKALVYPKGVKEIVESSGLFAGTFVFQGKSIGFLRIPSYTPQELMLSLVAIRYVFGKLDKETEFLVIDQTNNPGGYVAYSDWIISALVPRLDSNVHMKFKVRPTQSFLRTYAELIGEIREMANSPDQDLKKIAELYGPLVSAEFRKVRNAFDKRAYLSEPISLGVVSYFLEELLSLELRKQEVAVGRSFSSVMQALTGMDLTKRQKYTKPVAMLINELDFSGGDATPANLQDYGRVKLYGVNTAGAGGAVFPFQHSVLNYFSFRLTNSLMYRPANSGSDYAYVENIGVKPDVKFETKISDYQDNFSTFFDRFLATVF